MSLGPVMLDVAGTELSSEDRELLQHPAVGGVILFARNYANPQQLAELTVAIRALRDPQLLVAVDQEGGRVQRFREGFRRLPPAAAFGQLYHASPDAGRRAARMAGWLMASELQAVGVDFSFAPVLDVDRGLCRAIGDRAFAQESAAVAQLAAAWMQGARLAGMASVGKHFPGHGAVEADSHLTLPHDERSFEELWEQDLLPYRYLIDQGLEAVMPALVVYPAIDAQPAGFSSRWLQDILRRKMGFQGTIISDALDMTAAEEAAGGFVERSRAALAAGTDLLLVCNNRPAALDVVDALVDYCSPASQTHLARLYSRHFTSHERLRANPLWAEANRLLGQLDTVVHADLIYDPTTRGGTVI
ncbi:beta-N-acetylhexosaminidase [Thiothrix nivea]|uniref:Beta-hexosaminidase n=1 Tax=Thiothrix nivea (strain ATCC 35100 / DSM 5205 / JP2) TaxID=870187 RepID=A0A656HL61_THINJ|nr:beta-N-acetylhexosaminidase [Thiothrix nivea]EIJ36854.1 Beta-hexosaminidase [Thiothrix nivea DSM 5205]